MLPPPGSGPRTGGVEEREPDGTGRAGALWLMLLSVAGIGDAVYLTVAHYANVPVFCSSTGIVDCARDLTGPYSVVPGTSVPITVPGLGFFLVSLALALAQYLRPGRFDLRRAHFGWAALGLIAVFYLVFVELVEEKAICLWCTGVHVAIILILIITAWRLRPPETT